jgi:hypothetical protein
MRLKLGCKLSKLSLNVSNPVNVSVGSVKTHFSENKSTSISPVHKYSFTRNSSAIRRSSISTVLAGFPFRSFFNEEGEEDKDDDTSSSLFFILCLKVLATAVIPETIVFTAEDVSE